MIPIQSPFPFFVDLEGAPLRDGKVFFGQPNSNPLTDPIDIFWDEAGTQPVAQPLRTNGGFLWRLGSPANIFCSTDYSVAVYDSAGRRCYFEPTTAVTSLVLDRPDGTQLIGYTGSGLNAVTRTLYDRLIEEVHLLDYGDPENPPKGDGITDCTEAFRAAHAELVRRILLRASSRAGGRIIVPSGSFRVTDEIDYYLANSPRIDIEVAGQGEFSTQILVDFYGAGKSVFRITDPLGVTRASPVTFSGMRFDNVSITGGINPVFINILGWGEGTMENVRFGNSNNSHMRPASAQNCRFINVNSYGGGRSFNYKRTGSLTFSVNTGTKRITSSGPIFSAADVGKYFFIFPNDPTRRIRYKIATYVNTTTVTYADTFGLTETSVSGWFEPARCTINIGSFTLTANSSCFTSDMVGLVIYVRGAVAGPWGTGILRATISAYISGTQVTLDTAATTPATDQFFSVAAIDMGLPPGFDGSSDVKAFALRIEHYLGVGLMAQDTDAYELLGCKLHGDPTVDDDSLSLAAAWLDDFGGMFQGELDSTCSMADWRVHWCNANDTTQFALMATRGIINGQVFGSDLVTDPDGYMQIEGMTSYVGAGDPYALIFDANKNADATDRRIILSGAVNILGDSQKARIYAGESYFTPDGILRGSKKGALADLTGVTWNGTAPAGTKTEKYTWTQTDNVVTFAMRLEYATPGVTNSSLIVPLQADMPAPVTLAGADEIVGANISGLMGTAPNVSPSLSKAFMIGNGSGGWQFDVVLNSGTISAAFAVIGGQYFTS